MRDLVLGMNSNVFGEKLNHSDHFSQGFQPLIIFDGVESSGDVRLNSLLEYVIGAAREVFSASSVSLMLLNHDEELIMRISTGLSPDVVRKARRRLGEGVSGWVAKNLKPVLLNGPVNDPRFQGIDPTISCALSVPLVTKDRAIGVLNLNTRKDRTTFSQRDLEMASLIATALATAIESALVHQEAEEDSKQILMLFELGRALSQASSVQETLDITASMTRDFMCADICIILELQDKHWTIRTSDGTGRAAETELQFSTEPDGWLEQCLAAGIPTPVSRKEIANEEIGWIPSEITEFLVVPLLSSKHSTGILICGRGNGRSFDTRSLAHASTLSVQIVAAWDAANDRKKWEEEITGKERHRIAQELHDSLAQELSGLVLAIESCQMALNQDQKVAQAQLAKATRMARGCLSDVRQYMTILRSNRDEPSSLLALLERSIEDFRRQTGITVDFGVIGAEIKLANEVQQAFLRVAQEALTNIRKHARAANVRLQLAYEDGEGRLLIVDDGVGFDVKAMTERGPAEGKYGLLGMRERTSSIKGNFDISSTPGRGTQIHVRVPLGRAISVSQQTGK